MYPGASGDSCMPFVNHSAYSPVRYGSSPGVSMLRPQRGSRARLITGAQNVEKPVPTFIMARASRPIWAPVTCHSVRLNDMPVVIGNANLVVCVPCPRRLISLATPVEASLHQLYAGTPRPLMAAPPVPRLPIFSARVIRLTASAARASTPRVGLQNGMDANGSDLLRHGLNSSAHPSSLKWAHGGGGLGVAGRGSGVPLHLYVKTSMANEPPHFSDDLPLHAIVHPLEGVGLKLSLLPQ
mmetsp:Transcript_27304/g.71570  ORF Transcript_27304/g.71570 Transcript_27304/m.71570 type:complete len:240 (-) Transcript_27304:217-936(-)